MKSIEGNIIKLAKQGRYDVIVQGCNCFCTMGAGLAMKLKNEWPQVEKVDKETRWGAHEKLGHISIAREIVYPSDDTYDHKVLYIVNGYTQYEYGTNTRKVNYEAVANVFEKIRYRWDKSKDLIKIAYPMIGCGLAGGHWPIIREIIDHTLEGFDHELVIYKG